MSQSGLTDPSREGDWDRWYFEHLTVMVTVPGIRSAQRFKTATPGFPPSLAMYSVVSADVFQDPYYLSVRGMGEWRSLIDQQHYKRNLFDGLTHAPQVSAGDVLLVADRDAPEAGLGGMEWSWLVSAGIDRSTPYRAISVVDADLAEPLRALSDIAVYEPASSCHKPPKRS